jgi:hypothetical protein
VIVVQPDFELGAGQAIHDRPLKFNLFAFFGQETLLSLLSSLSRVPLPLPAASPANRALLLDPSHLAGRNIPSLPPSLAENPLFHDFFSKALQQPFLRFAIPQTHCCQYAHLLPGAKYEPTTFPRWTEKSGLLAPCALGGSRIFVLWLLPSMPVFDLGTLFEP